MFIKPTNKAKEGSIFQIHEKAEDFLLYSKQDDIPLPWDADLSVEGGNIVIEGSIRGGNANTPDAAGYCKCICSIEKFSKWYDLEVGEYLIRENPDLIKAIAEAGWVVVE